MTDGSAFTHRLTVRFRDCDALGHVNNAVYFTYLEQARIAWWRHLGGLLEQPLEGTRGSTIGLPGADTIIAHAECDYRAPAYMNDDLDIQLTLGASGRSSFTLHYAIVNAATGQPIAGGKTVSVTFDYATGRSIPIPEATRALLERSRG
jgi:acyl-CoA thioester hydrolase